MCVMRAITNKALSGKPVLIIIDGVCDQKRSEKKGISTSVTWCALKSDFNQELSGIDDDVEKTYLRRSLFV